MHDCKKHIRKDFRAAECDDQLEFAARVGRGVKGDSFKIECVDDKESEALTTLIGSMFDETTKKWIEQWRSDNINGGKLTIKERKNFGSLPPTFTLTFTYIRPDRTEWSHTTPAIPFVPDSPGPTPGSNIGVETLFLKDHSKKANDLYKEITIIDPAHSREEWGLPYPPGGESKISDTKPSEIGEPWSATLDIIETKEFESLSGLTNQQIVSIIQGVKNVIVSPRFPDISAGSLIEYINSLIARATDYATKEDIKNIFK